MGGKGVSTGASLAMSNSSLYLDNLREERSTSKMEKTTQKSESQFMLNAYLSSGDEEDNDDDDESEEDSGDDDESENDEN